jgi:hypothetical protein
MLLNFKYYIDFLLHNKIFNNVHTIYYSLYIRDYFSILSNLYNKKLIYDYHLVIVIIYIKRLMKCKISLDDNNIYKIIMICILLSIKFNDDYFTNINNRFCYLFNTNIFLLNKLEIYTLTIINYNLFINHDQFIKEYFIMLSSNYSI